MAWNYSMKLNEIQKKISCMECEKTFFISPELNAKEELEKILNKNLLQLTLHEKQFFISSPAFTIGYGQHDYIVFAQVNEHLWLQATVYLYFWEVVYLVGGHKKVNELNYIMSRHPDGENCYFFRLSEYRQELAICEYKFSGENNIESMRRHYNKNAKRVVMEEDGKWQIVEGDINLLPYAPKETNESINILARELGKTDFQRVLNDNLEEVTFNNETSALEWVQANLSSPEYYLNRLK